MFELDAIVSQVLQNCSISDSHNAGLFSVCGLALRLRDLYKWENGLEPWVEKDSSEILEWIGDKEQKWGELAGKNFAKITVFGSEYDPFDTSGINAALEPHGIIYGAGYAHSLKPTFFLAQLDGKKEVDGHTVYILGRELARDLLTLPALSQENSILIRKDSLKLFLWDKIFFIKKSSRLALKFALENYGLSLQNPKELQYNLAMISATEAETFMYHELGEIQDTIFDRNLWREVVAVFPRTPIEFLARSVKDLLADTNEFGALQYITREHRTASLSFYVAFLEGLTKELFPELIKAFKEFTQTRKWRLIEQATSSGYNTAKHYAEAISNIYQSGKLRHDKKWTENEIEKRLLAPLGIEKFKNQSVHDKKN
jgi:hypothetical protein